MNTAGFALVLIVSLYNFAHALPPDDHPFTFEHRWKLATALALLAAAILIAA